MRCDAFVVIVLSDESRLNQGRGLVNRKLKPPVILLLSVFRWLFCFWFFSDFRCGVPLFIVILYIYIAQSVEVTDSAVLGGVVEVVSSISRGGS